MDQVPVRIKLFMQWLQFWAWIGGVIFGVKMASAEVLKEMGEDDE